MGAPPIRNRVTESASPILRAGRIGCFDMTLPGTSQGSERPGQWGQPQVDKGRFQVSWWKVRTLEAVDVPHPSFGPHLPVVIPGRPQEYMSVPTAR